MFMGTHSVQTQLRYVLLKCVYALASTSYTNTRTSKLFLKTTPRKIYFSRTNSGEHTHTHTQEDFELFKLNERKIGNLNRREELRKRRTHWNRMGQPKFQCSMFYISRLPSYTTCNALKRELTSNIFRESAWFFWPEVHFFHRTWIYLFWFDL